jgi:hypothetical protein
MSEPLTARYLIPRAKAVRLLIKASGIFALVLEDTASSGGLWSLLFLLYWLASPGAGGTDVDLE